MRTSLISLTLLLCTVSLANGQERPDSAAMAELRKSMIQVMSQQEVYYSRHNTYTADATKLNVSGGLTVAFRSADFKRGYVAEATHPALGDGSCVMSVGQPGVGGPIATRKGKVAAEAGRVECDPPVPAKKQ
jgi:hypothetical protein